MTEQRGSRGPGALPATLPAAALRRARAPAGRGQYRRPRAKIKPPIAAATA